MNESKAMRSGAALSGVELDSGEERVSYVGEAERRSPSIPASGPRAAGLPFSEQTDSRMAELLPAHFRDVWRVVRRFGVPERSADDAAQEVFIIASRRLADITPGSERAFLLATAVRVAANARRSLATRREVEDTNEIPERVDPGPSAEALLDQKRLRQMLDEVLDGLTDELRVSFVLYELEGLSSPEISKLLGIPIGTVASRLRRAREAFELEVARLKARLAEGTR